VSESEILDRMFDAINSVMTIFSIFFSLVSGYLAALYLFLNRAPLMLRLVAFGLLSTGLCFLGGSAAVIQKLQDGLFIAWGKLDKPNVELSAIRNPLPTSLASALPISQQELGVAIGWSVAVAVYVVLAYLTFVYRWPSAAETARK
jgi:hypothetical protein